MSEAKPAEEGAAAAPPKPIWKLSQEDMDYYLKHTCLSEKEIEKCCKDYYAMCSQGNKTRLTKSDLCDVGLVSSNKDLERLLLSAMDENKDDWIDLREYIMFASFLHAPMDSRERYTFLFNVFDLDHSGNIKIEEFQNAVGILQRHGLIPPTNFYDQFELRKFFNKMDKDRSHEVSVDEFVGGFVELAKSLNKTKKK